MSVVALILWLILTIQYIFLKKATKSRATFYSAITGIIVWQHSEMLINTFHEISKTWQKNKKCSEIFVQSLNWAMNLNFEFQKQCMDCDYMCSKRPIMLPRNAQNLGPPPAPFFALLYKFWKRPALEYSRLYFTSTTHHENSIFC